MAFERLNVAVPPAPTHRPVDLAGVLQAVLVPLGIADRVFLSDSAVMANGFELTGLNGVLSAQDDGARINLDGQLASEAATGSLSVNVLAHDGALSGVVDHQLRSSMDYLDQTRSVNVQGRAWLRLDRQGLAADWMGQANAGPIQINGRIQTQGGADQPWIAASESLVVAIEDQRVDIDDLRFRSDQEGWALSSGAFEIRGVPEVLASWMPPPLASNLIGMQPSLDVISSQWQGTTGGFQAYITTGPGQASAYRNIPGGAFASAQVALDNWTGVASVQGVTEFHPAAAYDQPVSLSDGRGRISWTRHRAQHWQLEVDAVHMLAPDLDLTGRFSSRIQPNGSVFDLMLDFDSRGQDAQAWVPRRFLQDAGREFWDQATPQFQVEQGRLQWRRAQQQNTLQINANFASASLRPALQWPRINGASGNFSLDGGGITVRVDAADFAGAAVSGQVTRDQGSGGLMDKAAVRRSFSCWVTCRWTCRR